MRAHVAYLTQHVGRHRALPGTYIRTNAEDLTGHRRAVAALDPRVRALVHRCDDTIIRARRAGQ